MICECDYVQSFIAQSVFYFFRFEYGCILEIVFSLNFFGSDSNNHIRTNYKENIIRNVHKQIAILEYLLSFMWH